MRKLLYLCPVYQWYILHTFRSLPLLRDGVGSGAAGAAEAFFAAALMGGARTISGDGTTGCCAASTDFRPAADTGTAVAAGAGAGGGARTAGAAGAATIGGGAGKRLVC